MKARGTQGGWRRVLDWKGLLGLLVSAVLLYYAFRGVHFGEVLREIRGANVPLLILSAIVVTLVFPLRAFRWKPLLRPAYADTRFRPRFAATCIGFMANNLLPARVGEFARAWSLTRMEPVRVSASLGSLVVERMFDGLVVVGLLVASMAWPGFPEVSGRDFSGIALTLGAVFAAMFLLLLAMVVRPVQSVRIFERVAERALPRKVRAPVVGALEAFLEGIGAVRNWRLMLETTAWSLAVWMTNAASFWIAFRAFGIDVPFIGAVFLQSVIALAVALPSAPGFFGVFEAGARVGLVEVWGVETSQAMGFALGFHLAGFIPVTAMGLWYAWRLGISWREVEYSDDEVESAVEGGAPQDPAESSGARS